MSPHESTSKGSSKKRIGNYLLVERQPGIATVTINRPDKRNAMTLEMWRAFPDIMKALDDDHDVRAILIRGAGKQFCAGADIAEFSEVRADAHLAAIYEEAVDACCDAIFHVSKPTIAVVEGYCLGGGCHLAISCDFRYSSTEAVFGIPAARMSIVYGVRATAKLLALIGLVQAKRMLYSADRVSADAALAMGLVDMLDSDPMREAWKTAMTLQTSAPLTISGSKTILNGLVPGMGDFSPEIADAVINRAASSEDFIEARNAFMHKRDPRFAGR